MNELEQLLKLTCDHALSFYSTLDERRVNASADQDSLHTALSLPLPDSPTPPTRVIDELASAIEPGLIASPGPRYFGFVLGGSTPASLAADWLTSTWDQNACFYATSPSASVIEQVASRWLMEMFGLSSDAGVGFVTGCQMANYMGLASARNAILSRLGWDITRRGMRDAPEIRVITSNESHGTIFKSLAMLGFGIDHVIRVPCDNQGRMCADALQDTLAQADSPTIVCAQAGNVDTGSFDPIEQIARACKQHNAWLHVDGAFGLWAATSPKLSHLTRGIEHADSIAADAHKWLNVPYDSGIVFVRDRDALVNATQYKGDYLIWSEEHRDPCEYTPESSRRARAIPIYASIRELGIAGIRAMIERSCEQAHLAATLLSRGGARVLNDIVLNQTLFTFDPPHGADHGAYIQSAIKRIQDEGTCWLGGTTWQGTPALRMSICGWRTTTSDIERSVEAILRAASG